MIYHAINVIKKYVNDMLDKDFIKFNSFEYAAIVLIIKKSEDDLRVCVNYRILNVFTIKNRNASSFIKETLIRLCFAKIYSKFDIIVVFNEMRIKKKDEKKTIFLTRYELFEYVVMSFELCVMILTSNLCQIRIERVCESSKRQVES